jgi:hypothetical protein
MQDGGVFVVDDRVDALDVGPEQLPRVLLVEALDRLEQFLLTHDI